MMAAIALPRAVSRRRGARRHRGIVAAHGPRAVRQQRGEVGDRDRAARRARQSARQTGVRAPRRQAPRSRPDAAHDRGERRRQRTSPKRSARKAEGYVAFKVKVGTGDPQTRRRAHAAGVRSARRRRARSAADANQGWSVDEALEFVRALEGSGLDFFEQPVMGDDLAGHGAHRRSHRASRSASTKACTASRICGATTKPARRAARASRRSSSAACARCARRRRSAKRSA